MHPHEVKLSNRRINLEFVFCLFIALFMQGLNSTLSGNFDIPSEESRSATATASFVIACSQDLYKC